ncbi:MAG: DUF2148 domain-containing protein [Thermincolia bacterium]
MPRIHIKEFPEYSRYDLARKDAVIDAAKLMVNGAMTSPRGGGIDQVECEIVSGEEELEAIAKQVEALARKRKNKVQRNLFMSESVMVRDSDAIIFIGNYRAAETPLDSGCGVCTGKPSCLDLYNKRNVKLGSLIDLVDEEPDEDKLINGPLCGFKIIDQGHAVSSALIIAKRLFLDAALSFSVSMAGKQLGYCAKSPFVVAILVSARNKNPYVDIVPDYHVQTIDRVISTTRKQYAIARMVYWYDQRSWYPADGGDDSGEENTE